MVSVIIVEDKAEDSRRLRECLQYIEKKTDNKFDITEYSSGERLIGMYEPGQSDIIFFDIDMEGMNGMETARQVRSIDNSVIIVFITNMAQYVLNGYEVDALDFIIKPVEQNGFLLKMKRILERVIPKNEDRVIIKTKNGTVAISSFYIKYLEANGHYVDYHTKKGVYSEYTTLSSAEKKLNTKYFAKCNRSYLVNLRYVSEINGDTCVVDGEELIISRPSKKSFLGRFSMFLGGGCN